MDLRQWLVGELDETAGRLQAQVLSLIPQERRSERADGGNSVRWACYHSARHADAALSIVTGDDLILTPAQRRQGGGLEEDEASWSVELDGPEVDRYLAEVVVAARRYLAAVDVDDLDRIPATAAALDVAGVSAGRFEWLYRMWSDKPVAFFVRWPVIGHLGNHVGEMIATRNRMGLSPF